MRQRAAKKDIRFVMGRLHLVRDLLESGLDPLAPVGDAFRKDRWHGLALGFGGGISTAMPWGDQKAINASPLNRLSASRPRRLPGLRQVGGYPRTLLPERARCSRPG
jgi:hypothetical protein